MKYKVKFSDGTFEVRESDYEYNCFTKNGNLKKVSITLMLKTGLRYPLSNSGKTPSYRFKIPLSEKVEYPEVNYSIDPYVIGCLLGDGCCTGSMLSLSSDSDEIPNEIARLIGSPKVIRTSEKNYNWIFRLPHKMGRAKNFLTKILLKDFLNSIAVKTQYKRIPDIYKIGAIYQRLNLLQGLLDTDGTIDKKGRVSFFSINIDLIKDVQEICTSLGFVTGLSQDKRVNKYCTKAGYHLSILCKIEDKINLFRLTRKKQIALEIYSLNRKQKKYNNRRIISIEYEN